LRLQRFTLGQNKSPPDVYSIAVDDAIIDVPTMTQQPDLHFCFAVIKLKDGYF
jgi:hypothetical protein